MSETLKKAKEQVIYACKTICSKGYVLGTAGNISARVEDGDLFVITPSSYPYDKLVESDLVVADMDGNIQPGCMRKPSVEFSMHRFIYLERQDVKAIVHTHSMYATAVGSLAGITKIPAIDIETVLYLGGDINIASFGPPGSLELAESVKNTIGDNGGIIMENHGAIGVGIDMDAALLASDNIERTAELFFMIKAMGNIKPLPDKFIEEAKKMSYAIRGIVKPG